MGEIQIYLPSHDDYAESILDGLPFGPCQDALACGLYLDDPTAWNDLRPRRTNDRNHYQWLEWAAGSARVDGEARRQRLVQPEGRHVTGACLVAVAARRPPVGTGGGA
jgi:hypothetical protein